MTVTIAVLPAVLDSHLKWLRGEAGGQKANLYGANLSGANLTGANLTGADLTGADLTRAKLSGANLTRAKLSGANLYGANLYGANLSRANLTGADLTGADLTGANLSGANLSGASLSGANLIVGGTRSDGYQFLLIKEGDGVLRVNAGCRRFTIANGRDHWERTRGGTRLGHESQALLDHLERMASIAGWLA